jgi:hypothetical protein
MQYALPAAIVGMLVLVRCGWQPAFRLSAGAALVLGCAGLSDTWMWGAPFISFYNNVVFNIVYGVSSMFGEQPPSWNVRQLMIASGGLHALAFICGGAGWRRSWPIFLVIVCTVGTHMLVAHKEYRFVFLAIPLLLVLLAYGVALLASRAPMLFQKTTFGPISLVASLGCLLFLGDFPTLSSGASLPEAFALSLKKPPGSERDLVVDLLVEAGGGLGAALEGIAAA